MTQSNPTLLIYDDPSLAAQVQLVVFVEPWLTPLTREAFPITTFPRMIIPVLSWIEQDTEQRWKERLLDYLNTLYDADFSDKMQSLPGNFITAIIANMFYNSRVYVDCLFPPRLSESLSGSPYAVSSYWVAYHLTGMWLGEMDENTPDRLYRTKQLTNLRRIFRYMLGSIINQRETISPDEYVIVGAQTGQAIKSLLFVDADNLQTYFNQGHTIEELCTRWFTQKFNPKV